MDEVDFYFFPCSRYPFGRPNRVPPLVMDALGEPFPSYDGPIVEKELEIIQKVRKAGGAATVQ